MSLFVQLGRWMNCAKDSWCLARLGRFNIKVCRRTQYAYCHLRLPAFYSLQPHISQRQFLCVLWLSMGYHVENSAGDSLRRQILSNILLFSVTPIVTLTPVHSIFFRIF